MTQDDKRSREFRERGAASILFLLLIPVLFGAIALALDFGTLVYQREHLSNALDSAALAAAQELPNNPAAAKTTAIKFAQANDPKSNPTITFWCVVASSGAGKTVDAGQVPGICDPGTTAGARCSTSICAIPCTAVAGHVCNTITVADGRNVPFSFAPVIGIKSGNTGALSANACRGSCGAMSPNPMDVAIVADRTGSMIDTNRNAMVAGIKNTLQTMTQTQQYVALGTIHRSSATPGSCITTPSTTATTGPWIPVPFSNNYTLPPAIPGTKPPLNTSSTLVSGLNCLSASSKGTFLASPMKAAARYVLGLDPNNLSGPGKLPDRSSPARKAIIFETDGQPNETSVGAYKSLGTAGDMGSTDGDVACANLTNIANEAKAAPNNVIIVTVAFGDAYSKKCSDSSKALYVRDVLAGAASPDAKKNPSKADNDCSTAALRAAENSDGDNFFCAADGSELGPIFTSAINAISPNAHLLRIPD